MLTQGEITALLNQIKKISKDKKILFPKPGDSLKLDVESDDESEQFIIDVNRRGQIKISKCTYQTRYLKTIPLLRLDIDGPDHTNPNLETIATPHLHIYKEGYGDSWAFPIDKNIFTDTSDLLKTLHEFLVYNKVKNIPIIYLQEGGLI